jgi:hypothetical protein
MTSTTTTACNSDDITQKEEEYNQNIESFGIDEFEYELFQDDIKQATEEGNRKYGCWDIVKEFVIERESSSLCSSSDDDNNDNNNNKKNPLGSDNDDNRKDEEEYLDLIDEFKKKFHLKTVKTNKEIYYYDPNRGIYLNYGNIMIECELESRYLKELEEFKKSTAGLTEKQIKKIGLEPPIPWTRKAIDEFIGHIERRTYIDISTLNHNIEWIACEDCMINLKTGKTAQFDPKYLNTTQIPVKYKIECGESH